ncbi:MAG: O-antigen ligase family protein [Candidatus Promineifilaceae bacterium]
MPSDRSFAYWQRVKWVEGLILLAAAPFLLFPERFILLTALFLILLATLWLAPLLAVRSPLIPPTPFNAALCVFGLALCIAILVTSDPDLTLSKATGLILGLGVWRYLVLAIRQRTQVGWAMAAYLAIGLGFIAFGLLNADWVLKSSSQVSLPALSAASSDANNGGIHPNQIAGTITLVLPLLAALLISSISQAGQRPGLVRWALLLATLSCSTALLLTRSRSGWAGVLGGLIVLLLLWGLTMDPSPNRRLVRLSAAGVITLLLLLLTALGPQRLQQMWLDPPQETAVGSFSTLNFRQDLWPWAVQAIGDFPYTGIGLGSFREAGRRLYPLPISPTFDFAHAHNVFLQTALDVGIPGLIAYIALLLVSTTAAWQTAKKDRALRAASVGLLSSLAAFHIYGLADALALGSKPAVLLWAVFGLLAVMVRLR